MFGTSPARLAAIHSKSSRTRVPPASSTTASSTGRSGMGCCASSALQHQALSLYPRPGFGQEASDRCGIQSMFGLMHSSLERLERIVVAHIDGRLRNDRPGIDLGGDDVDGAAG